jgi:hypothetical protein
MIPVEPVPGNEKRNGGEKWRGAGIQYYISDTL